MIWPRRPWRRRRVKKNGPARLDHDHEDWERYVGTFFSLEKPTVRLSCDLDAKHIRTISSELFAGELESLNANILPISDHGSDVPAAAVHGDSYPACGNCENYATSRCAKCRAVRYCGIQCQQQHWHKLHKDDCVSVGQMKPKIRTGKSTHRPHGPRGVFATEDIPQGTPVAFFDYNVKRWHMHAIVRRRTLSGGVDGGDGGPSGNGKRETEIVNAPAYFQSVVRPNPDYDTCIYLHPDMCPNHVGIHIATGYVLEGRKSNPGNPLAVGHLVNDGAEPDFGPDPDAVTVKRVNEAMREYLAKSAAMQNVEMDDNFWYVTTKDVRKGQELFTCHDHDFWLQRQLLRATKPEARFLYYAIMNFDEDERPYNVYRSNQFDEGTNFQFLMSLCGYKTRDLTSRNITAHHFIVKFLKNLMDEMTRSFASLGGFGSLRFPLRSFAPSLTKLAINQATKLRRDELTKEREEKNIKKK